MKLFPEGLRVHQIHLVLIQAKSLHEGTQDRRAAFFRVAREYTGFACAIFFCLSIAGTCRALVRNGSRWRRRKRPTSCGAVLRN